MAITAFELIGKLAIEGIDKVINQLKGLDRDLDKFSKKAIKTGKALTTFVTLPILGIGAAGVKAASDLGESLNAIDVVFGDAAKTVNNFGETTAGAVGLAQAQFNELATSTGTLLKTTGQDIESVANSTIELTKRAADVASVFNVEVDEALNAFNSALRGEAEPARRFGVLLSAASVDAEILSSGLDKLTNLTEEQRKVQARYNLILKDTAQTQGDFSNTQDSLANRMRILKAEITDTAAKFGTALVPIIEDVLGVISDLVGKFSDLDEGQRKTIIRIAAVVAAIGPLLLGVGKAIQVFQTLKTTVLAASGPGGWLLLLTGALVGLGVAIATKPAVEVVKFRSEIDLLKDSTDELNKSFKTSQELVDGGLYGEQAIERLSRILIGQEKLLEIGDIAINNVKKEIAAHEELIDSITSDSQLADYTRNEEQKVINVLKLKLEKLEALRLQQVEYVEATKTLISQAEEEATSIDAVVDSVEDLGETFAKATEKAGTFDKRVQKEIEKIKNSIDETIEAGEGLDNIFAIDLDNILLNDLAEIPDALKEIDAAFLGITDNTLTFLNVAEQSISAQEKAARSTEGTIALYGNLLDLGVQTFTDIDKAIIANTQTFERETRAQIDQAFEQYKIEQQLIEGRKNLWVSLYDVISTQADKLNNTLVGSLTTLSNAIDRLIRKLEDEFVQAFSGPINTAIGLMSNLTASWVENGFQVEDTKIIILEALSDILDSLSKWLVVEALKSFLNQNIGLGILKSVLAVAAGIGGGALSGQAEKIANESNTADREEYNPVRNTLDTRSNAIYTNSNESNVVPIYNVINVNEEPILNIVSEGNTNGKIKQAESA